MSTRSIFPIPIYEVDFPDFNTVKDTVFQSVLPYFDDPYENKRRVDHFSDGETIKTLGTKFEVHKEPNLQFLVDFIEHHCKIYWKECGYTNSVDPYITLMWGILTSKGGFTAPHNHNPWPIAGAFYVNADYGSGDLFLENPLEVLLGKQPIDMDGPKIYTEKIRVKSGKLVLFPGWMRHHSQANTTNEQRLVLGFAAGSILESKPKS
jgi:uncharacterized protein (TIGR02466 family)